VEAMLAVQPIECERDGDGWLLSILATAALSGQRRATPKLVLGWTPVKAGRGWTARRNAGRALDGSTRTMEPPPCQIDGAAPVVKMAEEEKKGVQICKSLPRTRRG
jgi:hypothetical protein